MRIRFIPTRVGQINMSQAFKICENRFIPTRVGQMRREEKRNPRSPRFIPTRVGQIGENEKHYVCPVRFIPTRVGQMQAELYVGGAWVAVHPHACGADSGERLMDDITSSGSSPRVWGRCARSAVVYLADERFIPTRVGQIAVRRQTQFGEVRFIPTRVGQIHVPDATTVVLPRFIPTRVGQMLCRRTAHGTRFPVHPHACGADGI